jgi:hypothetical protein
MKLKCCVYPYVNIFTKETVWSCFDHAYEHNRECRLQYALCLKRTLKNRDLRKYLIREYTGSLGSVMHLKELTSAMIINCNVILISCETRISQPQFIVVSDEKHTIDLADPCFIFRTSVNISLDDVCKYTKILHGDFKTYMVFGEIAPKVFGDAGSEILWKLYTEK